MSYKTLPNSASDAHYTIHHKGGTTEFAVNQKMGGGTWIYLGTFSFAKGKGGKVVLSNVSKYKNACVTADAVRFGGGLGNIARCADGDSIWANTKKDRETPAAPRSQWQPRISTQYETSGYPRYLEGARYWMQWAGIPDSIYSPTHGANDYSDDYKDRGIWVNYLAGGTKAVPDMQGLNIPIDMSLAFHSDAGTVYGDSIIGTLGIYQTSSSPTAPRAMPTATSATSCCRASPMTCGPSTSPSGRAVACGTNGTSRHGCREYPPCCSSFCRTRTSPTCATALTRASTSPWAAPCTRASCASSPTSTATTT